MMTMTDTKKINLILLEYLIYIFPISFIIGNFAINISIVLIIVLSIYPLNKDIFYSKDTDLFYCLWEAESEADIHQAIENSPGNGLFVTMCTEIHDHVTA